MTKGISTERVFSLSCFEGLRLVRKHLANNTFSSNEELIEFIEHVEADGASLDLVAAIHLGQLVEDDCPTQGTAFYQYCIKAVVVRHQPIWSKTMRQGRKRFISSLSKSDQDVFAAAGLLKEPPPEDVVTWWDEVSGHARLIGDQKKMDQARQAELLTIEYEYGRLKNLGICKKPEWPGLDDNYAGYDVLSFDNGPHGLVNRLIEVKSTKASPLKFFISRNEWEQAAKAGNAYLFHIWDMNKTSPQLHIKSVAEVEPHIPSDNGKGMWWQVTVPVGASNPVV